MRSKTLTPAARQELRTRIARSRRRVERSAGRLVDQALLFGSWSEYVREHPARSLLAATGVGVALSGLLGRIPFTGKVLERVADLTMGAGWSQVFAEVQAAMKRHEQASAKEQA